VAGQVEQGAPGLKRGRPWQQQRQQGLARVGMGVLLVLMIWSTSRPTTSARCWAGGQTEWFARAGRACRRPRRSSAAPAANGPVRLLRARRREDLASCAGGGAVPISRASSSGAAKVGPF
jgi:hypothetical protein